MTKLEQEIKKIADITRVIHCETQEEAKELFETLDSLGYTWYSNAPLSETEWEVYKEETCYRIDLDMDIGFSSRQFYEEGGFTIYSFKELKEEEEQTSFEKYGFQTPTTFEGEICFRNEEDGYFIGYEIFEGKKVFRQWNVQGYCYDFKGYEVEVNELELLVTPWYYNESIYDFLIINNSGDIKMVMEIKDKEAYCHGCILSEGIIILNGWRPITESDNITQYILPEN